MKNPAFIKALQSFLNPSQLLQDEPMKLHTTFKIGGPADYLLFPSSAEEVGKILQLLKEYSIPLTILGNGSNVLVRDGGIRGAVEGLFSKTSRPRLPSMASRVWNLPAASRAASAAPSS